MKPLSRNLFDQPGIFNQKRMYISHFGSIRFPVLQCRRCKTGNSFFWYTQNFMQHVEAKWDLQFVNQLQSEWETSSETCETKSSLEASVTMEVMKHYWPANLLAAWPICTRGFSNQVADLKYENVHSVLAPSGNIPSCCTAFSTLLLWKKMRVCWYTFTTIDVHSWTCGNLWKKH